MQTIDLRPQWIAFVIRCFLFVLDHKAGLQRSGPEIRAALKFEVHLPLHLLKKLGANQV